MGPGQGRRRERGVRGKRRPCARTPSVRPTLPVRAVAIPHGFRLGDFAFLALLRRRGRPLVLGRVDQLLPPSSSEGSTRFAANSFSWGITFSPLSGCSPCYRHGEGVYHARCRLSNLFHRNDECRMRNDECKTVVRNQESGCDAVSPDFRLLSLLFIVHHSAFCISPSRRLSLRFRGRGARASGRAGSSRRVRGRNGARGRASLRSRAR